MASPFAVSGVDAAQLIVREGVFTDVIAAARPVAPLSEKVKPTIDAEPATRIQRISLSSDERDVYTYADLDTYRITMSPPLHRVLGIKLVGASLLCGEFPIHEHNNKLDVYIGAAATSATTFTVSAGEYTIVSFATALQAQLRTNGSLTAATVTYVEATRKLTVNSGASTQLSFRFGTGANRDISLATVMGFLRKDTSFAISTTSTNRVDLSGPKLLRLWVDELVGVSGHRPVAEIPLASDALVVYPGNSSALPAEFIRWERPIGRIDELTLRFRVPHKTLVQTTTTSMPGSYSDQRTVMTERVYHFEGLTHTLLFDFLCMADA